MPHHLSSTRRNELIEAANSALKNAYSPYSHFRVGAAIRSKDGRIFTGCNIENVSYSLAMCAERVALFKAISEVFVIMIWIEKLRLCFIGVVVVPFILVLYLQLAIYEEIVVLLILV